MEKSHSFARSSSTASKKSKKHLRGTRSLPAELNKKDKSHHHKHVNIRVNKKESRRHHRSKNSHTHEEYDTKSATKICKNIANDLLDYALDICLTRFVYETLPESIVWDLRDAWLDIVSMQWMDNSDSILQAPKGYLDRIFKNGDELSLPPAFDNWSRGTLVEYKPRKFEELVLDPFLRYNPLPTSCNVEIEPINQAIPSINVATTTSSIVTRDDEEEVEGEEKAWSTNASGGESFHNIVDVTFDGAEVLDKWNSPINARGMQSGRARKTFNFVDKASIELLYPAKFPSVDIKASSELSYKLKNGGTPWKEVSNGEDPEAKQLIAFKLPYQTSSESVRDHLERQARNKASVEEE